MRITPAIGETHKPKARNYDAENALFRYRYRHDQIFRKHRRAMSLASYYRRKEKSISKDE